MIRALALFAAVAALALGCGAVAPTPASVTVQSAAADGMTSEPLTGSSTLTAGAQGGFHVWVSLRLKGVKPGPVRVKHTIRRAQDGVLFSTAERTLEVGPAAADGTWEALPAWPAFMCPSPVGLNVIGVPTVIKLEVTTMDGAPIASGASNTTFACPAAQSDFCVRICSG